MENKLWKSLKSKITYIMYSEARLAILGSELLLQFRNNRRVPEQFGGGVGGGRAQLNQRTARHLRRCTVHQLSSHCYAHGQRFFCQQIDRRSRIRRYFAPNLK